MISRVFSIKHALLIGYIHGTYAKKKVGTLYLRLLFCLFQSGQFKHHLFSVPLLYVYIYIKSRLWITTPNWPINYDKPAECTGP